MAARRLKLRDKGEMEPYTENGNPKREFVTTHTFCHTQVRIGIRKDGSATQYCWRCEQLGFEKDDSDFGPDDPDDGEPIPEDEALIQVKKNTKVVPFKPRKVA